MRKLKCWYYFKIPHYPKNPNLNAGFTVITPGGHVIFRNLGGIMDTKFSIESIIYKTIQIAFMKIRQISWYRTFYASCCYKQSSLPLYCHDWIILMAICMVYQQILSWNCSASWKVLLDLLKTRKYQHITPFMTNLHWLPIQYRIQFEILLLIYKFLHGFAPSYLTY